MRIAFFTDTFLPQVNGVATSIANFATELGRRGHDVLIVSPAPKGKSRNWSAPGVKVVDLLSIPAGVYPGFRMSPFIGIPKVFRAIRAFKPDIIHFHTTLMVSVDAIAAAMAFGTPLVGTNHLYLTAHHTDYLTFISENPTVRRYLASAILMHSLAFYKFCNVCIAPSKLLIKELREDGFRQTINYLPNGVVTTGIKQLSASEKQVMKRRYKLRKNVLLHVGRLSNEKRVVDVLAAFAQVRRSIPESSLLIVGDGPERIKLERKARALGIAKDMVITGFIAPNTLMQSGLVGVADAFMTASPMEAQGMVIIEAMAFGLPIVAVAEGAVPEVVGKSGVLVKQQDTKAMAHAVIRLFSDAAYHRDMSERSLKRAEAYSIESLTAQLLSLYDKAIKQVRDRSRKSILGKRMRS